MAGRALAVGRWRQGPYRFPMMPLCRGLFVTSITMSKDLDN